MTKVKVTLHKILCFSYGCHDYYVLTVTVIFRNDILIMCTAHMIILSELFCFLIQAGMKENRCT